MHELLKKQIVLISEFRAKKYFKNMKANYH